MACERPPRLRRLRWLRSFLLKPQPPLLKRRGIRPHATVCQFIHTGSRPELNSGAASRLQSDALCAPMWTALPREQPHLQARHELVYTFEALVELFHRGGVRHADMVGRPERLARRNRNRDLFENPGRK